MIVAQLAERSLPTPEVRSLTTVIGKLQVLFSVNWNEYKIQTNEAQGMAQLCYKNIGWPKLDECHDQFKWVFAITGKLTHFFSSSSVIRFCKI